MEKFTKLLLLILSITFSATGIYISRMIEPVSIGLTQLESADAWDIAKPDYRTLKNGDLIFRHGRGFTSNAFMQMNLNDKQYSHAGILFIENEVPIVYHAIGGEDHPDATIRRDELAYFCNADLVHGFGIYRLDLSSEQLSKAADLVRSWYNEGIKFDMDFDLATDQEMYCSEFVYKAIKKAAANENYLSLTRFSGREYVACDNLYLNKHASTIYHYQYSNN
ncbi:MAG: hypothetical protein RIQ89_392 [Bacteroidota bacterium]|jgi:hypothetical protein